MHFHSSKIKRIQRNEKSFTVVGTRIYAYTFILRKKYLKKHPRMKHRICFTTPDERIRNSLDNTSPHRKKKNEQEKTDPNMIIIIYYCVYIFTDREMYCITL